MSKVYDAFADEYIDEEDKDINAPPERYREVAKEMLISNAARWFMNEFTKEEGGEE